MTEHVTMNEMIRRLKATYVLQDGPTDETVLNIGKHNGLTFLEIYNKHPGYLTWAIETVEEPDAALHLELKLFYNYIRMKMELEAREPSGGKSSSSSKGEGSTPTVRMTDQTKRPIPERYSMNSDEVKEEDIPQVTVQAQTTVPKPKLMSFKGK